MHYNQTFQIKRHKERLENREKFKISTYKGFSIRLQAELSSEILEARRQCYQYIKSVKMTRKTNSNQKNLPTKNTMFIKIVLQKCGRN